MPRRQVAEGVEGVVEGAGHTDDDPLRPAQAKHTSLPLPDVNLGLL